MKISYSKRNLISGGALLVFLGASIWVTAMSFRSRKTRTVKPAPRSIIKIANDPKLVASFERATASIKMTGDFDYAGVVTVQDGTDTSISMKNVPFTCSRKGNDCYMRYGHSEVINGHGVYIFIEHDQQKIWYGPQKEIITPSAITPATFSKDLASEGYQITGEVKGADSVLKIVNERHLSCKAYSISFDTASRQVDHIYARLTDFFHADDQRREKVVDMKIIHWSTAGEPDKYLVAGQVIRGAGREASLTRNYRNYELLNIR